LLRRLRSSAGQRMEAPYARQVTEIETARPRSRRVSPGPGTRPDARSKQDKQSRAPLLRQRAASSARNGPLREPRYAKEAAMTAVSNKTQRR